MGSILRKLDELLLRTDEDEAQATRQLRDGVASIGTKLAELSEVHDPPLTVTYWMRDARELSHDMEDCVDMLVVHADSDARKTAWVDDILGLRTRVEEVMERYYRFKLEHVLIRSRRRPQAAKTAASHRLRQTDSDEDLNTVAPVGMEGPKSEIVTLLKPKGDDEKEMQLKVVSILGVEGVGKSTLAQELWRILGEDQFECRAFVQASKKPNMRMILRSILLQSAQTNNCRKLAEFQTSFTISPSISKTRGSIVFWYFIIIDDLWAVSVWDTVSRAFPEGNCCSRIVTTTTLKDVALACCSYDPERIFKMKPLGRDRSKGLFVRTAFGSGKECPQQFHDVSEEITGKCGGLPLAIICIATLVSSKPEAGHQWEYVQNFLRENLRTNPTSVEILEQVLNLCYSSLPRCLKTCLLYLSVYPENYFILKEDLVKQWIAEDFVCATGEDIVEVASSYFDELVRCNVTVELPEQIGCLKHLETLEIQRVAAVPSEIIVRLASFKMKRVILALASKRAVVVFTLSSCAMSHTVMRLMADLGVNPLVHELDSDPSRKELERALLKMLGGRGPSAVPAVFIGGNLIGGTDRVMSLHVAGELVPLLRKAGVLWGQWWVN
ncbi:hypothetical protein C2845_PM03G18360 [Panicum miliaceum]|uniref:Uncharacterized protein n=1 Tax=Panicum miliaceum TaxID=4540 RepID=A0A3L6T6Q9_PANMI|nr:hypothetical protein C2845_PM03G18360 [Panicum miliaceum]